MNSPQLATVLGTRPEIIKLAPVIRECRRRGISNAVIHTEQHYSKRLSDVFFDQLELPTPDYTLGVGSGSHGHQTGEMLAAVEDALADIQPRTVLVQGDTNTALAGALAASKLDTNLGHVEAGLRSYDRQMPEEVNRVLCDHAADELFAPTPTAVENLRAEGLPEERISLTGNTVVDALERHRELARDRSPVLEHFDVTEGDYGLVTVHRAATVDDQNRFADVLAGIDRVARRFDLEMVYPIHPRARSNLNSFDVPPTVRLVDPLDYLDFLRLESEAALVLTDSGGVQEEACVFGVPCVTLRANTERPETLAVGANRLAGVTPEGILETATAMLEAERDWDNPFGDGRAAERILETPGVVDGQEVVR
ncbi:MAG: non-hydrolyzing UDP-N-acetylglucosamine 2-epimerase [Halobacteriota archaeon]